MLAVAECVLSLDNQINAPVRLSGLWTSVSASAPIIEEIRHESNLAVVEVGWENSGVAVDRLWVAYFLLCGIDGWGDETYGEWWIGKHKADQHGSVKDSFDNLTSVTNFLHSQEDCV
ncbi:hypothetical protein Tco_1321526 [Tanacetum coccineum]